MYSASKAFLSGKATRSDWEDLLGVDLDNADGKIVNVDITPQVARTSRDHYAYKNQRNILKAGVHALSKPMKAGGFRSTGVCAFALNFTNQGPDDIVEADLVNGNHHFEAIHEAQVPVALDIRIHIVSTAEQVDSLYATYDIGKSRNIRAVTKASGSNEFEGLGKRIQGILISASAWGIAGFDNSIYGLITSDVTQRIKWQNDHAKAASELEPWYEDLYNRHREFYKLAKRAQFAALVLHIQHSGSTAHKQKLAEYLQEFVGLLDGKKVNPMPGSPVYLAINALQHSGAGAKRDHVMNKLVHAWEAYYTGNTVPQKPSESVGFMKMQNPPV